jgi:small conductance mechanosensitive channel
VLDPLIHLLNDSTPLFPPWGRVVAIAALFTLAWLLSRATAGFAARLLAWQDRRISQESFAAARRRETLVGVLRRAVSWGGFTAALVLSVGLVVGGIDHLAAVAGASFLVVVAGFSVNRMLPDLMGGFFMVSERWFSVGDTIAIPILELQGVVEDVSLRHTRLRALNGEVIHVHNSQIAAVRVLPRGVKKMAVELYVSDQLLGQLLVAEVSDLLPKGPTTFLSRPVVTEVETLTDELTRITVTASVAPGREWLIEGFFCDLIRERSEDDLVVHGPVALDVDEAATRTYARAALGAR